jgi:hypothetical protein
MQVAIRKRLVHPCQPESIPHLRLTLPKYRITTNPPGQARPLPIFGPRDKLGPQCVALDVAHDGPQMVVVLNGERLEPSLPDMATGSVLAVISPGVSHKQPLHPTAQVPVALRADNQVEVVGHQAVPEDIQREPGARIADGLDKGVIVSGLVKDRRSTITTVEDVVPHPADGRSGSSRHSTIINADRAERQYQLCPLFLRLARVSSAPTNALSLELMAGHRLDLMLDVSAFFT